MKPLSRGAGLGPAGAARPGPGRSPRAAGASGKLLFVPRDLHFCASRPTRAKPSQCSPPSAPSPAVRASSSPGAAVGQRLRPEGHRHRAGNYLCLGEQGRPPQALPARPPRHNSPTPCSQPGDKAGPPGLQTLASVAPK